MTKKIKIISVLMLLISNVSFYLLTIIFPTTAICSVILYAINILSILLILYTSMYIVTQKNSDKVLFNNYSTNKEYSKAVKIFENKLNIYLSGNLIKQTKFFLLNLYFKVNDLNAAFDVLNNSKWGYLKNDVIYFKILYCLYNKDLLKAKEYLVYLKNLNKNILLEQTLFCDRIINCIDNGDFSDKFYIDSNFKIVEEIYLKYEKKS